VLLVDDGHSFEAEEIVQYCPSKKKEILLSNS
jgi:hypothetical protein